MNRLIGKINSRQESNNDKIASKQAQLAEGGLSAKQEKRLNKQIGRLESANQELEGVRGEIATLEVSDQVYNVVESSSQNERGSIPGTGTEVAFTSFIYVTGNVDITISPEAGLGLFSHELLHAYQFDQGQISLGAAGSMGRSFLLDKTDEVAGYARQGLFGSSQGVRVSSTRTLPSRYSSLPSGPSSIHNFTIQGKNISQMNEFERRGLARIMNQAFRYNGKTITGK